MDDGKVVGLTVSATFFEEGLLANFDIVIDFLYFVRSVAYMIIRIRKYMPGDPAFLLPLLKLIHCFRIFEDLLLLGFRADFHKRLLNGRGNRRRALSCK